MSIWQTISVKRMDGSTDHFTRFANNPDDLLDKTQIGSETCGFNGDIFWLSHDIADGYIITANDTSDHATIRQLFDGDEYSTERHAGSLWTYTVNHGPSYDWHDDILETVPDWVHVGGNWQWMD